MVYNYNSFMKNIIEHSERLTTIIQLTDFNDHSLNPNMILIPSLWNNVNDALIAWAMVVAITPAADPLSSEFDCRRNAETILCQNNILNDDIKSWLTTMKNLRTVYTSDYPEMEFNSNDCMVFLTAYDKFMYSFCTLCYEFQRKLEAYRKDYKSICSMRDTFLKKISKETVCDVPKALKKCLPESSQSSQSDENSIEALLRQLIKETKKTNELLEKLLSRR